MRTWPAAIGTTLLLLAPAHAGPPLLTDDPWLPTAGLWEINTAYTLSLSRQSTQMLAPLFNPGYSFTDHLQLQYTLAWLVQEQNDQGLHTGLSDSQLQLKWRFLDQNRAGIDLSIEPGLEFNNPTSSVRHSLVQSGTILTLPLEIGWTHGPTTLFAETGYQFIQHSHDQLFLGLAAGYQLTPHLQLLAELFTSTDTSFRQPQPLANLGAILTLSDNLNLLFSIGRSLRDDPATPWLTLYTGLQLHF